MVTSLNKWKILECDENTQTNKTSLTRTVTYREQLYSWNIADRAWNSSQSFNTSLYLTDTYCVIPLHNEYLTDTYCVIPLHSVYVTDTYCIVPLHYVYLTDTYCIIPLHNVYLNDTYCIIP